MNLKHPRSDAVISVDPGHAASFLSQGWVEQAEAPEAPAEAEPERPKRKRAAAKS